MEETTNEAPINNNNNNTDNDQQTLVLSTMTPLSGNGNITSTSDISDFISHAVEDSISEKWEITPLEKASIATDSNDAKDNTAHFNPTCILTQTSVDDAQLEKVIDDIVELGGCQQFTQTLEPKDESIDKDKEVEDIQREIIGQQVNLESKEKLIETSITQNQDDQHQTSANNDQEKTQTIVVDDSNKGSISHLNEANVTKDATEINCTNEINDTGVDEPPQEDTTGVPGEIVKLHEVNTAPHINDTADTSLSPEQATNITPSLDVKSLFDLKATLQNVAAEMDEADIIRTSSRAKRKSKPVERNPEPESSSAIEILSEQAPPDNNTPEQDAPEQPEPEQPAAEQPESGQPESEQPEPEQSEPKQPEQPASEQPESKSHAEEPRTRPVRASRGNKLQDTPSLSVETPRRVQIPRSVKTPKPLKTPKQLKITKPVESCEPLKIPEPVETPEPIETSKPVIITEPLEKTPKSKPVRKPASSAKRTHRNVDDSKLDDGVDKSIDDLPRKRVALNDDADEDNSNLVDEKSQKSVMKVSSISRRLKLSRGSAVNPELSLNIKCIETVKDRNYKIMSSDEPKENNLKCSECKYTTTRIGNMLYHTKKNCPGIAAAYQKQVEEYKNSLQTPKKNKRNSHKLFR